MAGILNVNTVNCVTNLDPTESITIDLLFAFTCLKVLEFLTCMLLFMTVVIVLLLRDILPGILSFLLLQYHVFVRVVVLRTPWVKYTVAANSLITRCQINL